MKIFTNQANNGWNLSSLLMCVDEKRKISSIQWWAKKSALLNFLSEKRGKMGDFTECRRRREGKYFPASQAAIFSTQLSDNRWTIANFSNRQDFSFQWKISCSYFDFHWGSWEHQHTHERVVPLYKNGTGDIWEWLKLSLISLVTNTTRRYFIIQLRLYLNVLGDCCCLSPDVYDACKTRNWSQSIFMLLNRWRLIHSLETVRVCAELSELLAAMHVHQREYQFTLAPTVSRIYLFTFVSVFVFMIFFAQKYFFFFFFAVSWV